MPETPVKEHMEVIGADGVHIGTVDRVENGRIKLTKADSGEGRHKGHHHFIDLRLVADVEGQKVRLSANAAVAVTRKKGSPQIQCDGTLSSRPDTGGASAKETCCATCSPDDPGSAD